MEDLKDRVQELIPLSTNDYRIDNVLGTVTLGSVPGDSWRAKIKANVRSFPEVQDFIDGYMKYSSETIKIRTNKTVVDSARSPYLANVFYRCQHDTRYELTRDTTTVLQRNPLKRIKDTYCPFSLSIKVKKGSESYPCDIFLAHEHNHPTTSLEALSHKSLSESVVEEVNSLFVSGYTSSSAYREFLCSLRRNCTSELDFHIQKADRSLCPRRRDFNSIYSKYCRQYFGGKNGEEMFSMMFTKIEEFKAAQPNAKVEYSVYNNKEESPLILAIVTPLTARVHQMVSLFYTL